MKQYVWYDENSKYRGIPLVIKAESLSEAYTTGRKQIDADKIKHSINLYEWWNETVEPSWVGEIDENGKLLQYI
jgi:hypothetical protein